MDNTPKYKIFKYSASITEDGYNANLPKTSVIIRCDKVATEHFVWAIVDPEDKIYEPKTVDPNSFIRNRPDNLSYGNIGIIEEQILDLPNPPEYVEFGDGFAFAYYERARDDQKEEVYSPFSGFDTITKLKRYKLIGRKTGQEIGYSPDQLTYLGMLKIWIKQELGIYMFLVRDF